MRSNKQPDLLQSYADSRIAALVWCCERDAAMLPLFVRQFRLIHPTIRLSLADCGYDPLRSPLPTGLQRAVTVHSAVDDSSPVSAAHAAPAARALFRAYLEYALETGADYIWKCDVDVHHRASMLPTVMAGSRGLMACGIQWRSEPQAFLGASYLIARSALMEMAALLSCHYWVSSRGEDYLMSQNLRRLYPNQIHLLPNRTIRNAVTDDGHSALVHCGCYQGDRQQACAAMQVLAGKS